MEQIKEVKTVKIDYLCPKCENGYLRPTGTALATYPPKYPHICTKCQYGETFTDKTYPYIDYQEV